MRYKRYRIIHIDDEERKEVAAKRAVSTEEDKPADWEFMKQSGEVLADIPDTWKAYPHDTQGMKDIICMEYHEFKKAESEKDMSHELVHLASACLYLWRHLNDAE